MLKYIVLSVLALSPLSPLLPMKAPAITLGGGSSYFGHGWYWVVVNGRLTLVYR